MLNSSAATCDNTCEVLPVKQACRSLGVQGFSGSRSACTADIQRESRYSPHDTPTTLRNWYGVAPNPNVCFNPCCSPRWCVREPSAGLGVARWQTARNQTGEFNGRRQPHVLTAPRTPHAQRRLTLWGAAGHPFPVSSSVGVCMS